MTPKNIYIVFFFLLLVAGCQKKEEKEPIESHLTLFIINDQQGQIDNFAKVKYIIDKERQQTDVLVTCGGDIFSGNPVVDNYEKKGYPMIDLMNKVGFNIAVIGNHEFDYGEDVLAERMKQAEFDWVCANADMALTGIPQPSPYKTLNTGNLKVTFLGLIETNGKPDATIPSTHPWRVEGIAFERPENVVAQYAGIKEQEQADLYIALTHIGHNGRDGRLGDFQLAEQFPYFDLIIGGHSSQLIDTVVNGIPVFQAGSYLEYMGKIELSVKNKKIDTYNFELIDLNSYPDVDAELQADIEAYNASMAHVLDEVIGYSQVYHQRYQVGCFYTDALRERLDVDVTFQNYGGIRSHLDEGDITVREIYEIDPFHNAAMIYNMPVSDIKNFLKACQSWVCYSGIEIVQTGNDIQLFNSNGNPLNDDAMLTIGINDYIPAVYDSYFPAHGETQPYITAEAIIFYLKNINHEVNYPDCDRYFKYK